MSAAEIQRKSLSAARLRATVPRLERRISELEALAIGETVFTGADPKVVAVDHAVTSTVADIFGTDSLEYSKLAQPFFGSTSFGDQSDPRQLRTEQQQAIALLKGQVALLNEQIGQEGTAADRAMRAYSDLDLHPEIARAASDLYRDGHYANAIEDAVKALNAYVRYRSGVELDGVPLMQKVFSPNGPVLQFNDMHDPSDKDEQQGFMMMFSGAVAGLRNPRAHKLIKDDPERALEFVAFVSLLAKLLDGAKK